MIGEPEIADRFQMKSLIDFVKLGKGEPPESDRSTFEPSRALHSQPWRLPPPASRHTPRPRESTSPRTCRSSRAAQPGTRLRSPPPTLSCGWLRHNPMATPPPLAIPVPSAWCRKPRPSRRICWSFPTGTKRRLPQSGPPLPQRPLALQRQAASTSACRSPAPAAPCASTARASPTFFCNISSGDGRRRTRAQHAVLRRVGRRRLRHHPRSPRRAATTCMSGVRLRNPPARWTQNESSRSAPRPPFVSERFHCTAQPTPWSSTRTSSAKTTPQRASRRISNPPSVWAQTTGRRCCRPPACGDPLAKAVCTPRTAGCRSVCCRRARIDRRLQEPPVPGLRRP